MSLSEIIEQLEQCGFKCEGGALEHSQAFIELKAQGNRLAVTKRALELVVARYSVCDPATSDCEPFNSCTDCRATYWMGEAKAEMEAE